MEKRIFAAVLISIGFLWLWAAVAPKLFPDLMKKPVPAKVDGDHGDGDACSDAPAPVTASTTTTAPRPSRRRRPLPPPSRRSPRPRRRSRRSTSPDFVAQFSNRGAELVSFQLTHYKAKPSDKNDQTIVELVKEREPSRTDYPFAIEANDAQLQRRAQQRAVRRPRVRRQGRARRRVPLVRRRARGHEDLPLQRRVSLQLRGLRSRLPMPYRVAIGPGIRTLGPDEKDNQFIVTGNGVVQRDDSLKVINREKADTLERLPGRRSSSASRTTTSSPCCGRRSRPARSCARSTFRPRRRTRSAASSTPASTRRRTAPSPARHSSARKRRRSSTATASRRRCSSASSASSPASSWPLWSG